MKKSAYLILIAVMAAMLQGCSENSFIKKIMKKMPWAKEEKVEKTELDILREQLQSLEDESRQKEDEIKSMKDETKLTDEKNKKDTLEVRWKCRSCGQIATARKGHAPSKCMYCSSKQYDRVEVQDGISKEVVQKNRRTVELQKEIQELNIKISSTKEMIKLLEKKGSK